MFRSFLPALAFLTLSCQPGPTAQSPEEVVRQYQAWYDANHYEAAQRLSTEREGRRLEELAALLDEEVADSTLLQTRFLDIRCREAGEDLAYCDCLLEDQYERYQTRFTLRRVDGQWLVDLPEPDGPAAPPQ